MDDGTYDGHERVDMTDDRNTTDENTRHDPRIFPTLQNVRKLTRGPGDNVPAQNG